MKYELEFRNLEQIRQLLNEDRQFEACTTLLALGSLLIQNADLDTMKPVMLLGQYSKISKQLLNLFETLMTTFSPNDELKEYKIRLQDVNAEIKTIQSEYRDLEKVNVELLAQEKALRDRKEELQKLTNTITELKNIKEKEIEEQESQQEQLKEKLELLNEQAETTKSLLERYKAELSEDGRLIRELPEQYGTTKNVDELIAEIKKQEQEVQNLHSSYEQGLTNLIEQIRISYEILKGGSYE